MEFVGKRVLEHMESRVGTTGGRVIFNLDPMPEDQRPLPEGYSMDGFITTLIETVAPLSVLVKVNTQQSVLCHSLEEIKSFVKDIHAEDIPTIVDHKLSDIHNSNRVACHYLLDKVGFDGIIASPLIGYEGGIETILESAKEHDSMVVMLAYMSHKGASDFFEAKLEGGQPMYRKFLEKAVDWGVTGAVVGGTQPEKLKEASDYFKERDAPQFILSPGFGAQGADIGALGQSLRNFFPAVGRSVLYAWDDDKYRELGFPDACVASMEDTVAQLNGQLGI